MDVEDVENDMVKSYRFLSPSFFILISLKLIKADSLVLMLQQKNYYTYNYLIKYVLT